MSRPLLLIAAFAALALPSAALSQDRQPASAETRATYDRMDPLSRSLFWQQESEINPADPVAGVRLAQALRELGQFDQAVQAADKVLVVQPDNAEAMIELGRAHIARGQAFYGIAALEKAGDLLPGDWRPWSLLGVAYQQVRREADAQLAWAEGLRLSPDNPSILSNMAMVRLTSGDLPGAEALLRRAAAQPQAGLQVKQNLALVLGLSGNLGEAETILRRELPPQVADQNLAWIRERAAGPVTADGGRTWQSLQ
ncbi:MAG: tetratricopeptide repeat protein [Brevundimonas sp.]|uniref:tetratricopeptide repeat protein n=1 Tax=Brevundimonas sp. TaxID=1871086 RepID=UPI002775F7B6|nr:tetratricopeptide repeat protein [Brevundimonas sp.]MDP3400041.1 tetratricopeptide repeat protein [Brevundimonas sp.]MDZ4110742.1 tetratricopeptide repeat protein [Brevundimonas sp.]